MGGKGIRRAVLLMIFCLTACGGQNNAATQNNIFPQDNAAVQSVSTQDGAATQSASVQDDAAAQGAFQSDSTPAGDTGREQEESGGTALALQEPEERQGHDWRTEEWQIGEEAAWEGQLYAGEYIYGLEASPNRAYAERRSLYQTWGHRFYALEEYTTEDGESFYYMNSYDSFTGEILHLPLEFSCPEEYAGCEVRLANFDIQTEAEWVVFLQIWPDEEMEEPIAYLAMHLSPEGELLSWVDLYPFIREYGGRRYHYLNYRCYVDRQGYYYLILTRWPDPSDPTQQHRGGERLDPVYILDPEGRLEAEMRPLSGKYPEFSTKTPDGTPLFDWEFSTTYFWMMYHDREAGQFREVMEKVGSKDSWTGLGWAGTLTEDGYLYFLDNSMRLSRCDLYTGKRDYCLRYGRLGLGNNPVYIYMVPGPEGDPVILDTMDENGAVICRLTRQEPETDPVRLVSLTENCTLLENQAMLFSKNHLENPVEVEKPEGNAEDYRTRMLAELVSGKGADIYYVSAQDMRMLYENGVLADLTEVLSPEVEAAVYPGVLEGGTVEGRRMGLAVEARPRTMLVSGQYGEQENWTLEALLDLADAHPELRYPIVYAEGYMDGYRLLMLLLCQDMGNSPFLDLDNGICDFENPLFVRLLELAGRYQEDPIEVSMDTNQAVELMEEGAYAAVIMEPYGFPNFSSNMAILGEDCRTVGFPGKEGGVSYWQADYYLVVNNKTRYPELACAYLEFMLGEKSQDATLYSVRRDLLEKHIIEVEGDEIYPLRYSEGNGGYIMMEAKPDGSSWQEEYEEIREQCVAAGGDIEDISTIILEEAKGYFDRVRDAETVAALIQNRVQLYLNEQGSAARESGRGKGERSPMGSRNSG